LCFDWLTFDEGYGGKPEFLREVSARGHATGRGASEFHRLAEGAARGRTALPSRPPRAWPQSARLASGSRPARSVESSLKDRVLREQP